MAEQSYFGLQASWGVTKHLGGKVATDQLARLCRVSATSRVLEVGCGTGITACHLAGELGCQVVGIDLNAQMVARARKRVADRALADLVQVTVADAAQLPFADGCFDVVISESVTAFVPDKARAVQDYLRVLVPGGRVGLTEATWTSAPPRHLVEFLTRAMDGAEFLEPDGWWGLIADGGAEELHAETFRLPVRSQLASDLGRQGWRDVVERAGAMGSFLAQYARDPELRRYTRTLVPAPRTMRDLFRHYGYGIYTGHKPG